MRIFLLANSWVGLKISEYLLKRKENIVALGIHEKDKQKYTQDIIKVIKPNKIFVAGDLRRDHVIQEVTKLHPDIIIAAFWGYILKPKLINIPPLGCINFHPGYLPYNRGMNPNVWPFIERTPAGVTLHYIDEGIDSGDIIAQKKIEIDAIDTAGSIEVKTWREIVRLFKQVWPKLKKGRVIRKKQNQHQITFHYAKDVNKLDEINLDKKYKARDLINILRARSYQKRAYAYYRDDKKKTYIKVSLAYNQDLT